MSAQDIVNYFKHNNFYNILSLEVMLIHDLMNEEDILIYLTYNDHHNILEKLLGKEHNITIKYNSKLNLFIKELDEKNDEKIN